MERNFLISMPFGTAHLVAGGASISQLQGDENTKRVCDLRICSSRGKARSQSRCLVLTLAYNSLSAQQGPVQQHFSGPRDTANTPAKTALAPSWGQKIDYSGYIDSGIIPGRLGAVTLRSLGHLEGRGN